MLHMRSEPPADTETVVVGILLNEAPNGAGFLGYQPIHPLRVAFTCLAPTSQSDIETLEQAFFAFNVGDDPSFGEPLPVALAYRARRNRSLSVGDVVTVDKRRYACANTGWDALASAANPTVDSLPPTVPHG